MPTGFANHTPQGLGVSGDMREVLLSIVGTPAKLETIGFWILVAGLAGEFVLLFLHEGRLLKVLTGLCVLFIVAGVWLEHVGAEEGRAARKLRSAQREQLIRDAKPIAGPFILLTELGAEPLDFGLDIAAALQAAGWEWRPYRGLNIAVTPIDGRPRVGSTVVDHIEIQAHGADTANAATKLADALKNARLDDVRLVFAPADPGDDAMNVVHVIVGAKK
jgi:hypothetical protein